MFTQSDATVVKPVVIQHENGTKETVLIPVQELKGTSWKEVLQVSYTAIGTLALILTAYFTYKQIKSKK